MLPQEHLNDVFSFLTEILLPVQIRLGIPFSGIATLKWPKKLTQLLFKSYSLWIHWSFLKRSSHGTKNSNLGVWDSQPASSCWSFWGKTIQVVFICKNEWQYLGKGLKIWTNATLLANESLIIRPMGWSSFSSIFTIWKWSELILKIRKKWLIFPICPVTLELWS